MQAAVLVNPHAGGYRRIANALSTFSKSSQLFIQRTESIADLASACHHIHRRNPDWLAVAGGDGTLSSALTALMASYGPTPLPPILVLPCGTMNMVARSLGHPSNPAQLLRAILQDSQPPRIIERDCLQVSTGNRNRYGFIFGLGLVSHFLEVYYEGPRTGAIKAAELVLRASWSILRRDALAARLFQPVTGSLLRPNQPTLTGNWTALLTQTIENLGIGFRPMYRAFEQPQHFHSLATTLPATQLLRRLPHIFQGKPWPESGSGGMTDWIGQQYQFQPHSATSYTLDGDIYQSSEAIDIRIGPRLRLITSTTFNP